MNISKIEQRVLHVLAQGGHIRHMRASNGRVTEATCLTRDGFGYSGFNLDVFRKLVRKKLIQSLAGKPYRISRKGRVAVRSQLDNR
jgi:uncharacterized protein